MESTTKDVSHRTPSSVYSTSPLVDTSPTDRLSAVRQAFQVSLAHHASLQAMLEELALKLSSTESQLSTALSSHNECVSKIDALEVQLNESKALVAAKSAECDSLKTENRSLNMIYRTNVQKLKEELVGQNDQCAREHVDKKAIARLTGKGRGREGKNLCETVGKVKRKVADLKRSVEGLRAKAEAE